MSGYVIPIYANNNKGADCLITLLAFCTCVFLIMCQLDSLPVSRTAAYPELK